MMEVATLASALAIVGTIVSTTVVVLTKLTRLEVMITELRGNIAHFEHRIGELERRR